MFSQEKLNLLIEEDFVFSSDIATKILTGKFRVESHGIDDWLRSLTRNKLKKLIKYCDDCIYEFLDNKSEEETVDVRDLISVTHLLLEMETGREWDLILIDNSLVDFIQRISVAANLDLLRRLRMVKVEKKGFLHIKNSHRYTKQNIDE